MESATFLPAEQSCCVHPWHGRDVKTYLGGGKKKKKELVTLNENEEINLWMRRSPPEWISQTQ